MIHECYGPNVVANHNQEVLTKQKNHNQEAAHETMWERMIFGKQSS